MMLVMLACIGLGFVVGIVALFVRWEREGKEQLAPLGLLGMLVVEATLYADQNTLPRGLFHPGSGSLQLRLPEIYITLALLARLIARGQPNRIGLPAGLWGAFAAWMAVGVVEGYLNHNGLSQNLYEAKSIIYVVGGFALAAGVPVRRYIDTRTLFRLRNLCVAAAIIVDLMTAANITLSVHLPLLPLYGFGGVGSETAALYVAVGAVCFLVELAQGRVRLLNVLTLVPPVAAVILADERAVLVNLGVVIAVMVLILLVIGYGREAVARLRVHVAQIALTLLAFVALGVAVVVGPAALSQQPVHIPMASTFHNLFHSEGKAESAQDRLNMAAEVEHLIPKHPIVGWGLGIEFPYYEPGVRQVLTTPYAHDIVLDLWLRLGLIGLLAFLTALVVSLINGLSVWRHHPDPVVAALALGLVSVLAGLCAHAMLEPFLDEYRLATLFGVSLGILRSAVTSPSTAGMITSARRTMARV
jgi:O-antigen ligase